MLDCAGQTINVIEHVETLLLSAHSSKDRLIKVQVFLRDMSRGYGPFRDIWDQWMESAGPPVWPLPLPLISPNAC